MILNGHFINEFRGGLTPTGFTNQGAGSMGRCGCLGLLPKTTRIPGGLSFPERSASHIDGIEG